MMTLGPDIHPPRVLREAVARGIDTIQASRNIRTLEELRRNGKIR